MTVMQSGTGLRLNVLGNKVDRTAATLPATTTTTYFTISVGRILLLMLLGEVTTVVQAQATTFKWTSTPTVGTAVDMCATADLNAKEAGTMLGITGLPSDAMVATNAGLTTGMKQQMILPIGNLRVTTGATSTGATKWSAFWIPIDDGALLVAA
jgi:hypothetical protein